MKRLTATTVIASAIVMFAGIASAGYKAELLATIVKNPDGSGYAFGAMGSVRNSPDAMQELTCTVYFSTGSKPSANCLAFDANGRYLSCTTQDPILISRIEAIASDSQITFWVDTAGKCIHFTTAKSSRFAPKVL